MNRQTTHLQKKNLTLKSIVLISLLLISSSFSIILQASDSTPTPPYKNPNWADSAYPLAHTTADFTPWPGPVGPSRRLGGDEVLWKTVGPMNNSAPLYSTPYPNGKRVVWVGGYDRISKLDAETLDVLTTYAIGGNTYFGDEEIRRHIATVDDMKDQDMVDYNVALWEEPWRSVGSFYRLLSNENELYIPHRTLDGGIALRVYGEVDATDPSSKIELRREWRLPAEVSKAFAIMGVNMTPDGWVVMATMDGAVIALSKDFKTYHTLQLPATNKEHPEREENKDIFASFLRNGLITDDQGGIYIVTRYNMHRVQWTGKSLSLDEADGAWTVSYPNELGIGSGTTPALMGWGDEEDHLVIITDGSSNNNMLAIWRDGIPDDWQGLPGLSRRIAGTTPIHFGVSDDERILIENAPVVYGYGVFFNNTYPVKRLPKQGGAGKQWMIESLHMHIPGHEARGGTMIQWNAQTRTLETAWQTQENLVSAVCTVSGATELLYCWGARDREWTLEGLDWHTGESAFHYTLGKSHRFNTLGGPIIVAPNGAIDCACVAGLGLIRVKPKKATNK